MIDSFVSWFQYNALPFLFSREWLLFLTIILLATIIYLRNKIRKMKHKTVDDSMSMVEAIKKSSEDLTKKLGDLVGVCNDALAYMEKITPNKKNNNDDNIGETNVKKNSKYYIKTAY